MQESSDNAYYGDDMLVTTSMSALSSALDTEPTCPAGTFSQYEPVGPDVVARLVSLSDKVCFRHRNSARIDPRPFLAGRKPNSLFGLVFLTRFPTLHRANPSI
jgi:hypothetical protein